MKNDAEDVVTQLEEAHSSKATPSLEESKDVKYKTGIIYISYIPLGLTSLMIRNIFSKFGEVGRIFLQQDKSSKKVNRKKPWFKRKHSEGWVEMKKKRVAKEIANTLNRTPIRGYKGVRDHLWSIKYLPRFKWVHLAERLNYEKIAYQQKMLAEINQAKREANFFSQNINRKVRKHEFRPNEANEASKEQEEEKETAKSNDRTEFLKSLFS